MQLLRLLIQPSLHQLPEHQCSLLQVPHRLLICLGLPYKPSLSCCPKHLSNEVYQSVHQRHLLLILNILLQLPYVIHLTVFQLNPLKLHAEVGADLNYDLHQLKEIASCKEQLVIQEPRFGVKHAQSPFHLSSGADEILVRLIYWCQRCSLFISSGFLIKRFALH